MCVSRVLAAALLLAASAVPLAAQPTRSYSLEQVREIVRSRHPALESAQAAIEQAQAVVGQQKVFADPRVIVGYGRGEAGPFTGAEWRAQVVQPFQLPGFRKWRVRAAEAGVGRAELERLSTRVMLDAAVGRLFADVLLARESLAIAGESAAGGNSRRDAEELVDADPRLKSPDNDLLRKRLIKQYGEVIGLADVA